jgi:hypothetical protein
LFLLPSVFVDVGDNLVMADDVATPSNPPVATINKEEFEEAMLDETSLDEVTFDETLLNEVTFDETLFNEVALKVNVSQRLCEEEPSRRVVRTRINRSAWDR